MNADVAVLPCHRQPAVLRADAVLELGSIEPCPQPACEDVDDERVAVMRRTQGDGALGRACGLGDDAIRGSLQPRRKATVGHCIERG